MKILFAGCVKGSAILLEELIKNGFTISGIITMKESKFNSDFCSLDEIAVRYSIDYFYTQDINDKATVDYIKSVAPDVIYCFGWSYLIKKEILDIPSKGVVGFHPASLPYNKGRHPLIWALALGLKETASTFFIMDEGADTGDIISQKKITIEYADDAGSLYEKVLDAAKKQVVDFSNAFEMNKISYIAQGCTIGNSWRKRGYSDGQIDWRMSMDAIYNLVRALTHPYVGAHFIVDNKEIKVWKVRQEQDIEQNITNIEPGKIIKVNSKTDFCIKAYDGIIHVINCDPVDLIEGEYLY